MDRRYLQRGTNIYLISHFSVRCGLSENFQVMPHKYLEDINKNKKFHSFLEAAELETSDRNSISEKSFRCSHEPHLVAR